MSLLIVHVLLLTLALGASASDKFGLRGKIDTPLEKPLTFSRTCDFFSSHSNDFINCTAKDIDSKGNCNKTQHCKDESHCYMSWFNTSGVVKIVKSGCWMKNADCHATPECRARNGTDSKGVYFCCCLGDNCNRNFHLDPALENGETDDDYGDGPGFAVDDSSGWLLVLYILLPLCMVCAMIILAYWCYRKRKSVEDELDRVSVDTPATGTTRCTMVSSFPVTNEIPTSPQFLDVKARGRFGKVWRAQLHDKIVAVKTFDLGEKASWQNEQDIFCTPLMNSHDNILKFFLAHNRGNGLNLELWLITEFYDRGSLADFLKVNTVTFLEALRIMKTMASGMSFLHEDVQDSNGYKPSIAHRDFKSKNVLLDQNLNAVIADFGLAVKFTPGESPGESHGQVGTLRYMAPEVLEGAINFQKDAFLRIDMYAFGLVIWEISTRCTAFGVPGDFKMPFEAELGASPSMDCMQEFVVEKKLRPQIKDEWKTDKTFSLLCETMEECWDHDAEARLSAGCVELRVAGMQRQRSAVEATQLIVNTSPTQNGFGDTEVMNQRNLQKQQLNIISNENNKNLTQQMNGPQTTSFSEIPENQGQYNNKVQGDTYVIFSDDDHDSGTFANEDTLSHDGIMEQLIGNEDSESVPDVVVAPGDVSSDTSLLTSSERESDL